MARDDDRLVPPPLGLAAMPSDTSAQRLASSLHDEFGGYRERVHFDLMAAEVLHEEGDLDAAARILTEHIEVLSAFATQVDQLVSGAAVEREAEAIVDAAWLEAIAQGIEMEDAEQGDGPGGSSEEGAGSQPTGRQRVRNVVAVAAAALVVVVALVTPNNRGQLDGVLVAAERATDEAVAVAYALAELSEPVDMVGLERRTIELHDRIRELPREQLQDAAVRNRLEHILSTQAQTLAVLVPRLPNVRWLLEQLEALAADLSLRLEYQEPQPDGGVEPAPVAPVADQAPAADASATRPARPPAAGSGSTSDERPDQPQRPSGEDAAGGAPAPPQQEEPGTPSSSQPPPDQDEEGLLPQLFEALSDPEGGPEEELPPVVGDPG